MGVTSSKNSDEKSIIEIGTDFGPQPLVSGGAPAPNLPQVVPAPVDLSPSIEGPAVDDLDLSAEEAVIGLNSAAEEAVNGFDSPAAAEVVDLESSEADEVVDLDASVEAGVASVLDMMVGEVSAAEVVDLDVSVEAGVASVLDMMVGEVSAAEVRAHEASPPLLLSALNGPASPDTNNGDDDTGVESMVVEPCYLPSNSLKRNDESPFVDEPPAKKPHVEDVDPTDKNEHHEDEVSNGEEQEADDTEDEYKSVEEGESNDDDTTYSKGIDKEGGNGDEDDNKDDQSSNWPQLEWYE